MQIETITQHRHISLCHIWCLVDKLVALSGLKCRCFSSPFTILVATVTFVGISTLYIFFSLWGQSLSWKLFLTKCSYPTEYYWGLVLVCNAVCKLSRYEWFAFSWCGQMQYFLSICLTKMRLPHQCLWQKSDTKAFLSAIGYCYCNFKKLVLVSALSTTILWITPSIYVFQEVICEGLACIRCWPGNILTA